MSSEGKHELGENHEKKNVVWGGYSIGGFSGSTFRMC
jgi:hypothetical protein